MERVQKGRKCRIQVWPLSSPSRSPCGVRCPTEEQLSCARGPHWWGEGFVFKYMEMTPFPPTFRTRGYGAHPDLNKPCFFSLNNASYNLLLSAPSGLLNSLSLMKWVRSFPPFSLRCEPRGKQSAPFQFPTSEGRAEPRATLTFRSLKMIRSANGCLEPVRFTRLSNHFQMQEGYATGGL